MVKKVNLLTSIAPAGEFNTQLLGILSAEFDRIFAVEASSAKILWIFYTTEHAFYT